MGEIGGGGEKQRLITNDCKGERPKGLASRRRSPLPMTDRRQSLIPRKLSRGFSLRISRIFW